MFSFLSKRKKLNKVVFTAIVLVFGFQLLKPATVFAQGGPTTVIEDLPRRIKQQTIDSVTMVTMNFLSRFIDKIAYDTAKALASGARGNKPVIYRGSPGEYMKKTASEASASAVDQLFKEKLGFGICKVPDINFRMNLQAGLRQIYGDRPQAECDWTDVKNNWQDFKEKNPNLDPAKADDKFVESFRKNTGYSKSGFGVAMKSTAAIGNTKIAGEQRARLERIVNESFKPVKDTISGDILTPSETTEEESKSVTQKARNEAQREGIQSALESGSVNAIAHGASVFVNTLAGSLLDQLLNGGLVPPRGGGSGSSGGGIASEFAGPASGYRQAAEKAFSFLVTNPPSVQLNQINLVNQFSTCPPEPEIRGKNNCVIGQGLAQAIQEANTGDPLTIEEALEQGLIENKPIVPPDHSLDKTRNCYKQGYCYSNIKKLRKARILPLGFEIAAKNADADQLSWTLKKVMDGFQDCNRGQGPMRDAEHPYCHLIDPNWIIKAPETMCVGNKEPGPQLTRSGSANRKKRCVNTKSCVKRGSDGSCQAYGYCVKEESTWQLPGESCPAQYNTCTTYFDEDNQAQSYLSRSLEFGECNAGNTGCRAYSLEKKNGDWLSSVETISQSNSGDQNLKLNEGRNKIVHFDDDISGKTCSKDQWGCSEFFAGNLIGTSTVEKTNEKIHLKQAPSYLSCYDADPSTAKTDRPQTIAEAKSAFNNSQQCENFASACVQEEVGCKDWDPVTQPGDSIPGKIGQNTCARECVGYGTFRQRATEFDPAVSQVSFIPDDGQSCPARFEGCSEFTNLAESGAGGERREYYTELTSCENPTGDNQKTFYTWEGREGEGFKLQKHQLAVYVDNQTSQPNEDDYTYIQNLLKKNSIPNFNPKQFFAEGTPKYNSFDKDQLQDFYKKCNENSYKKLIQNPRSPDAADPGCRAFYDEDGNAHYRLASKLREVSDQCHRLRKTETNLKVDGNISNFNKSQQVCEARGGNWDSNSNECNVCRGGGTYSGGHCIYKTVSTPDSPNSCIGPSDNPDRYKGCRAYDGTTAGNVSTVFEDGFEPTGGNQQALNQARSSWDSNGSANLSVTAAALQTQLHSLKATFGSNGVAYREIPANRLTETTEQMNKKIIYELTFWARGDSQALNITLEQQGANSSVGNFTANPVSISGAWRRYKVGPATFKGDPEATTTLEFSISSGNNKELFLDNVELTEREGAEYVIKDSWKRTVNVQGEQVQADVPLTCDGDPKDNTPGAALGCSLYEDSFGNRRAAVEFERLCRPNAVGCRPVFETHNSDSAQEQWFKVKASTSTKGAEATVSATIRTAPNQTTSTVLGSCQTRPEETSCFVDEITIPNNITNSSRTSLENNNLVSSTMVVPSDASSSSPIYLTDQQKFRCNSSAEGCSKVAKQKQSLPSNTFSSYKFESEQFLLNDPDDYVSDREGEGTLCRDNLVGCQRFNTQDETVFFKDPEIAGSRLCNYKEGVNPTINGQHRNAPRQGSNGWFKDGVGVCKYENKPRPAGAPQGKECNINSDCTVGSTTGTCKFKGTVPCYSNAQTASGDFKLWSNKSQAYDGYVGSCPASENQCTQLVDRSDTSPEHPDGKPYYRIFDNKIEQAASECSKVSKKEGCVLFDDTTNPDQKYNTKETYEKSRDPDQGGSRYSQVEPVTGPSTDPEVNADMILQVNQNRQCSEWWAPSSQKLVYQNGKPQLITTDLQVCRGTDESGRCTKPVNVSGFGYCETDPSKSCSRNNQCKEDCIRRPQALTEKAYVKRDTSFAGWDYSGYSILNMYQIDNFVRLTFDDYLKNNQKKFLVYKVPDSFFRGNPNTNPGSSAESSHGRFFSNGCQVIEEDNPGGPPTPQNPDDDELENKDNWAKCGPGPSKGRCYEGMCIKPIKKNTASMSFQQDFTSTTFAQEAKRTSTSSAFRKFVVSAITPAQCKIYPEEDAPYPHSVLQGGTKELQNNQRSFQNNFNSRVDKRYEFIRRKADFSRANICQNGNCACSYKKVSYGSTIEDYWNFSTPINKDVGICSAGSSKGEYCKQDSDCGSAGNCEKPDRIEQHSGSFGYCLEKDGSLLVNGGAKEMCLSWLPIETSATTFDIYNNDPRSGYYPLVDSNQGAGKVYCLDSENYGGGQDLDAYGKRQVNQDKYPAEDISDIGDIIVNPYMYDNQQYNWSNFQRSFGGNFFKEQDLHFNNNSNDPRKKCYDENKTIKYDYPNKTRYWYQDWWKTNKHFDTPMKNFSGFICASRDQDPIVQGLPSPRQYALDMMRLWGYSNLTSDSGGIANSRLLRMSLGSQGHNYTSHNFAWGLKGKGKNIKTLFSFDPAEGRGTDETGVLMHPPRFSPNDNMLMDVGGKSPLYNYSNDTTNYINTKLLAPNSTDSNELDLYTSEIEENITESQINSAYFVPLRYPAGQEGHVPALLSESFNIPISDLKCWADDNCSKGGNSQYVPSKDFAERNIETASQSGGRNREFENNTETKQNFVRSYILSRDKGGGGCGGINSYCKYNYQGSFGKYNRKNTHQKDRIHTRYLTVMFETDRTKSLTGNLFPPQKKPGLLPGKDPFQVNRTIFDAYDGLTVIAMDFNKEGDFLGYVYRSISPDPDSQNLDHGIQYATFATLKDQCTDFAQVYEEENLGTEKPTNKAWTDLVWDKANSNLNDTHISSQLKQPVTGTSKFNNNTVWSPFGTTLLSEVTLDNAKHYFDQPTKGVPLRCDNSSISISSQKYCSNLENAGYDDGLVSALSNINQNANLQNPYDDILMNLFAKAFDVKEYDSGNLRKSNYLQSSPKSKDVSGQRALDNLKPPRIFSVNPKSGCGTRNSAEDCLAADKNNITVNGQTGFAKDYDSILSGGDPRREFTGVEGDWKGLVGVGNLTVNAKFFAFADKNRMPIRRVVVNWGDQSSARVMSNADWGYYKNRKPFCGDSSGSGVSECYNASNVQQINQISKELNQIEEKINTTTDAIERAQQRYEEVKNKHYGKCYIAARGNRTRSGYYVFSSGWKKSDKYITPPFGGSCSIDSECAGNNNLNSEYCVNEKNSSMSKKQKGGGTNFESHTDNNNGKEVKYKDLNSNREQGPGPRLASFTEDPLLHIKHHKEWLKDKKDQLIQKRKQKRNQLQRVLNRNGLTCSRDSQCNIVDSNMYCDDGVQSKRFNEPVTSTAGTPDFFSNASRACTEGFFQYRHQYTCTASDLSDSEIATTVEKATEIPSDLSPQQRQWAGNSNNDYYDGLRDRLIDRGLSLQDEVCVYRPKVQVLDNWGWCNGSCPNHIGKDGQGNRTKVTHPNNEGCYTGGVTTNQCDEDPRAWTKFKGKIIVVPRQ